jgi:hypothetical protein
MRDAVGGIARGPRDLERESESESEAGRQRR